MYLNSNNHNLHQSTFIEKIEILRETKNDLGKTFLAESQGNLNDKNRLPKKDIANKKCILCKQLLNVDP